ATAEVISQGLTVAQPVVQGILAEEAIRNSLTVATAGTMTVLFLVTSVKTPHANRPDQRPLVARVGTSQRLPAISLSALPQPQPAPIGAPASCASERRALCRDPGSHCC